jgi:adenylyl-sulfate kinase
LTAPGLDKGFCLWLMGLSASGKTTLARLLKEALTRRGFRVEVLDGDQVRATLSRDLGFSRQDREVNLRRIALLVRPLLRHKVVVVVAAICPYEDIRREVRAAIGEFVEVYLDCPLEVCIRRDPKGLYCRALAGEIPHFTGIDDPFERPARADIVVRTGAEGPRASLDRILAGLEDLKRIPGFLSTD